MQINKYLTSDDVRQFTARSDLAGAGMLLANWAMIVAHSDRTFHPRHIYTYTAISVSDIIKGRRPCSLTIS